MSKQRRACHSILVSLRSSDTSRLGRSWSAQVGAKRIPRSGTSTWSSRGIWRKLPVKTNKFRIPEQSAETPLNRVKQKSARRTFALEGERGAGNVGQRL